MNKLSWLLRGLMVIYFISDAVFVAILLTSAFTGDTATVQDMLDFTAILSDGTKASAHGLFATALIGATYLALLGILFWNVHKLLQHAAQKSFATSHAGHALKRVGQTMVGLYVITLAAETIVSVMLYGQVATSMELEFSPFDENLLLVFVGAAIWLMAGLASDAEKMKEELSYVI